LKCDKIKLTVFGLVLFLLACCFNSHLMHLGTLPMQKKITVGEPLDLGFQNTNKLLAALQVDIIHSNNTIRYSLTKTTPVVTTPGKIDMSLKLFGLIPLRQVTIDVVQQTKVIPGGHSVGILLHATGVLIVGMSTVEDASGNQFNPAKDAGIKIGDVLLKINGTPVKTEYQVRDMVIQAGKNNKSLQLDLERQGKKISTKIMPIYNKNTQQYALGLLIRDSAAGVGTLTFYHPETKAYGALGHVITDVDTGKKINMSSGRLIGAYIKEINPGQKGLPGEKVGVLETNNSISGSIEINTYHGIFGRLSHPIKNPFYQKPIPVAVGSQIKEGPAEIVTVLDGDKMEKFNVEIEKVSRQLQPEGKGMIIKITDPRLLSVTGGIIQGMSGSPIIQYYNGQPVLVGAVTHVFINDPTRGYGVLAEWMLQQAQQVSQKEKNKIPKHGATAAYSIQNAA